MRSSFQRIGGWRALLCAAGAVTLGAIFSFWRLGNVPGAQLRLRSADRSAAVPNLATLLALSESALPVVDIARMNLLCAQGLPGAGDLDVNRSLAKLGEMAARVRTETERHYYRFQRNPAEFENSEGFFRMLMLAVVLAEDFHVQYAPNRIGSAANAHPGDGFFADAHDVFLHGLTGATPRGTCSSLPVLQVAIGRRLGYPLKLVTTKGHLFVRWEDAPENAPHRVPLPIRWGEGVRRTGEGTFSAVTLAPSDGESLHEPRRSGGSPERRQLLPPKVCGALPRRRYGSGV